MSTGILLKPVNSGDDGYFSGSFNNSATSLVFGNADPATYDTFIRFPSVNIPQGSTIHTAVLTYTNAVTVSTQPVGSILVFDQVDNAIAPTDASEYLTIRARADYDNQAIWDIFTGWTADDTKDFTDFDFVAGLQAVVNRPGWVVGNAILLLHRNANSTTGAYRQVYSINQSDTVCPSLYVTYSPNEGPTIGEKYPLPAFKNTVV